MSVFGKLVKAREDFHKLELKKSGQNKFAGYSYFELSDFLVPALGVLKDNGLCSVVSFGVDIATMTIFETEGDGKIVFNSPMGSAALKGCHEVQNIGAVETYQRRYLYMTALEIVEHDALDATTGQGKTEKPKQQTTKLSQVEPLMRKCESKKGIDQFCKDNQKLIDGLSKDDRDKLTIIYKELVNGMEGK